MAHPNENLAATADHSNGPNDAWIEIMADFNHADAADYTNVTELFILAANGTYPAIPVV